MHQALGKVSGVRRLIHLWRFTLSLQDRVQQSLFLDSFANLIRNYTKKGDVINTIANDRMTLK